MEIGTRQGGLTSPLISTYSMKNFYQTSLSWIAVSTLGIIITMLSAPADDILICSFMSTGPQKLVYMALSYTKNYGLKFSAAKTNCVTYDRNNIIKMSHNWTIKNERLGMTSSMSYLGTILDSSNAFKGSSHIEDRIRPLRRPPFQSRELD